MSGNISLQTPGDIAQWKKANVSRNSIDKFLFLVKNKLKLLVAHYSLPSDGDYFRDFREPDWRLFCLMRKSLIQFNPDKVSAKLNLHLGYEQSHIKTY